jgi:hypothetical protein
MKSASYKRDDYNFPIVNFPFICRNIPAASPNGVLIAYISELVVIKNRASFFSFFVRRLCMKSASYE